MTETEAKAAADAEALDVAASDEAEATALEAYTAAVTAVEAAEEAVEAVEDVESAEAAVTSAIAAQTAVTAAATAIAAFATAATETDDNADDTLSATWTELAEGLDTRADTAKTSADAAVVTETQAAEDAAAEANAVSAAEQAISKAEQAIIDAEDADQALLDAETASEEAAATAAETDADALGTAALEAFTATAEAALAVGTAEGNLATTNQAISDAITAGDAPALNLANAQKTIDTARLAAAQDDLADATTAMNVAYDAANTANDADAAADEAVTAISTAVDAAIAASAAAVVAAEAAVAAAALSEATADDSAASLVAESAAATGAYARTIKEESDANAQEILDIAESNTAASDANTALNTATDDSQAATDALAAVTDVATANAAVVAAATAKASAAAAVTAASAYVSAAAATNSADDDTAASTFASSAADLVTAAAAAETNAAQAVTDQQKIVDDQLAAEQQEALDVEASEEAATAADTAINTATTDGQSATDALAAVTDVDTANAAVIAAATAQTSATAAVAAAADYATAAAATDDTADDDAAALLVDTAADLNTAAGTDVTAAAQAVEDQEAIVEAARLEKIDIDAYTDAASAASDAVTAAQTAVTTAQEAVTAAVDYDSAVAAQTAAASAVTLAAEAVVAAQAAVDAAADTDSADDNTAAATVLGTAQGLATDAGTADTNADSAFATLSSLQASVSSVDEGSTVIFTLDGGAAAAGKTYSYSITGDVGTSDITSGSMIGTVVADSNGVAIAQVTLNSDVTTEGAESLTVTMNRKTATVTVNDTSAAPAAQTDFTITAAEIVTNNAIANANQMAITGTDSGTNSVTIQSSAVTSDGGFVYAGDADVTITSGAQGDSITVVSEGDSTITSGAGDDTITIVGGGSNTINVGAGDDTVTGGTGNDRIVFASADFDGNDVVDGGLGTDTVVISGDGNVVDGGNMVGIENLELDGTGVTITSANLSTYIASGLVSISGSANSSEITISAGAGATVDLSGLGLTAIKSITATNGAGGNIKLVLSEDQINNVTTIAAGTGDSLSIQSDVAGLAALGAKAPNATVFVVDSTENMSANSALLTTLGATVTAAAAVTVAEAEAILALGLTSTYDLADSAANLANAPLSVFSGATTIAANTAATAAEATAINASIDDSSFAYVAGDVTINVTDTSSNVANYYSEQAAGTDFDTVTATDAATSAEADAMDGIKADAVFAIQDTWSNIYNDRTDAQMDTATSITATTAVTDVVEVVAFNNASTVGLASGYTVSDDFADLTANANQEAVTDAAGDVTVTDDLTVSKALTANAWSNTGATAYNVDDAIALVLASSSAVVNNTVQVSTTSPTITASQANNLVAKFGASKVSDANLVISDTVANLLTLSDAAAAEANSITVSSGTATVEQMVALEAKAGGALDNTTVDISDTAANLVAAVGDAATFKDLDAQNSVTVSDTATIDQAVTINAALTKDMTAGSYTVNDTTANVLAAVSGGVGLGGEDTDVVTDAGTIQLTTAATIANIKTIDGQAANAGTLGSGLGTDFTYTISDAPATLNTASAGGGDKAVLNAATSYTANAALSLAEATQLIKDGNFDDVYSIEDTNSQFVVVKPAEDATLLTDAVTVTISEDVGGVEADLTYVAYASVDAVVLTDSLAALDTSRGLGAAGAVSFATSITINEATANGNDDITMGNIAEVNALVAVVSATTYTVVDSYGDFYTNGVLLTGANQANENGAVTSLLNNAAVVEVSDAMTASKFNNMDGATTSTIYGDVTDSASNLAAATGANALANALSSANGTAGYGLSFTADVAVDVAQIETLETAGATVTGLDVTDTAAAITAGSATAIATAKSVSVSDNGTVTGSVAVLVKIFGATGNPYANYLINDTAVNVNAANVALINNSQGVTVTDASSDGEATNLSDRTTFGTSTVYSVEDTATKLAVVETKLDNAVNVTVTGGKAASLTEAVALDGATNSGTTTYDVEGNAATLGDANLSDAQISAIENAGTVTVSDDVTTLVLANVIAGFTKAVDFDVAVTPAVFDTISDAVLNEAGAITISGTISIAQLDRVSGLTNSGTTTVTDISDTVANMLTMDVSSVSRALNATTDTSDAASASEAATLVAATDDITIAAISDSAAALAATASTVLDNATTVTASDALTVAQFNTLNAVGNLGSYSLTDSYTDLMVDSDADGTADATAGIAGATTVTLTDATISIQQATDLEAESNNPTYVFNIKDNDANIVASLAASDATLTAAASVTGHDGVALDIQVIGTGSTYVVSGTKAEIEALSSVIQAGQVAIEATVADLEANPDYYNALAANQSLSITDTVENLTGGNAILAAADHIVVSDAATLAQATTIDGLSGVDTVVYSLSDTGANLTAGGILNGAVDVTATGVVTEAQAEVIADATNTGSNAYSISTVDTAVDANPTVGNNVNAYEGAGDISVTGTAGIDGTQAAGILAAANTGSTTIALVKDAAATVVGLTLGANDTITAVEITGNGNLTVVQAEAIIDYGAAISGTYNLVDTAEALAAASSDLLNGATVIDSTGGTATVAQATILLAATNSGATSYQISDTAEAILGASAAVLEGDANSAVVVTDTSVTAAVATQLNDLDVANANITVAGNGVGDYTISDTYDNVTSAANETAVDLSGDVTVTGTLTVAQGVTVNANTAADSNPTMTVEDSYTTVVINQTGGSNLDMSTVTLSVSGNLNIAQAKIIVAYNSASETYSVVDTAANVATNVADASVTGASSVTLSGAGTVANVDGIAELTNLVGGYSITDSATAVQTAIDTANATGAPDRALVENANVVTLNTSASVDEALGSLGNTDRGLSKLGVSYSITDTVTNMLAGLAGIDATGITGASALYASDDTAMSITEAATLTSLANFIGYDDNVVETNYYLSDTFTSLQAADITLVANATTVRATGTVGNDNMNLSMHSVSVDYYNGDLANNGSDTLSSFVTGTDKIVLSEADLDVVLGANLYDDGDDGTTVGFVSFDAASGDATPGNAGQFIFDEVAGILYLDVLGDDAWTDNTDTLNNVADNKVVAIVGSVVATDIDIVA